MERQNIALNFGRTWFRAELTGSPRGHVAVFVQSGFQNGGFPAPAPRRSERRCDSHSLRRRRQIADRLELGRFPPRIRRRRECRALAAAAALPTPRLRLPARRAARGERRDGWGGAASRCRIRRRECAWSARGGCALCAPLRICQRARERELGPRCEAVGCALATAVRRDVHAARQGP